MAEQKLTDTITVRVAHDGSRYIVYDDVIPPLDGQRYVSVIQHERALAELRKERDELAKAAVALSKALRAHDRWQMEYGGEGYYDGCFQSHLSQQTEEALRMFANLYTTPPVNEEALRGETPGREGEDLTRS